MTTSITPPRLRAAALLLSIMGTCFWLPPAVSARTITLTLEFARQQYTAYYNSFYNGNTYYTLAVLVSSDTQPATYDEVDSPGASPSFSGTESGYGYSLYGDIESVLSEVTNGVWTLIVNKGDPSQQQYTFTVSVNGLTNGLLPAVQISVPADGSTGISTNTAFAWSGPGSWDEVDLVDHSLDYSFYTAGTFSPPVGSWPNPPSALLGTNEFEVTYKLNASPWVTISTPVNSQSQPFTNWVGVPQLDDFAQSLFVTSTNPAVLGAGHTLFAHYTFTNYADTFQLGDDSSPANNSLGSYSYWGPVHTNSADAIADGSAVQFFGASCMLAVNDVLTNYDNLLAGSFTFSAWVNTTNTEGNNCDNAISGTQIFWAYNGGTNDTIPLAITGSKAAFSAGDSLGNTTTIHSTTSVNDGHYHLITITREQATGLMKMYVDGQLQAAAAGPTNPLDGNNNSISAGGSFQSFQSGYTGLLDDMQVYSGVLSAGEVAEIYANPGVTISNVPPLPTYGLVAHYDFDEGTVVAPDVSGNGNNMVLAGNFGGNGPVISSNAIAGSGSVCFDGGSFLTASSNLLSTLAGNFSISLWLNTTQDFDYAGDDAYNGAGVISAYVENGEVASDLIPVALTGGQVAFDTGNAEYQYDDTLTSFASVNDGSWHHVVVCRNQFTGEKFIYVDGVLDTSDRDTTASLDAPQLLTIGAIADASNPDPASPEDTGYNGYQGLLDDVQIYNRVLSSNEVAFLYSNPGVTVGQAITLAPLSQALLMNLAQTAGNIEFSFQTLAGRSHTVQSRTNLFLGSWVNLTNFTGDGSLRQFIFPATNPPAQFFRVETQ